MKRSPLPAAGALIAAAILGAALYDAGAIVTQPLWPLFAWMLP